MFFFAEDMKTLMCNNRFHVIYQEFFQIEYDRVREKCFCGV